MCASARAKYLIKGIDGELMDVTLMQRIQQCNKSNLYSKLQKKITISLMVKTSIGCRPKKLMAGQNSHNLPMRYYLKQFFIINNN